MAAACGRRTGKLTAAKRRAIPPGDWGIWSGKPSTSKYPMPDSSHAANAKARAQQAYDSGHLSARQRRSIETKANRIIARCARAKRGRTTMARTAVVNRRRKRRRPSAHGAARKRRRPARRRNAGPANPRPSRYSSLPGGYYRRPNKRTKNPSLFKVQTWTKVLPPATLGVLLARWAVKIAGPWKPDAAGVPVPGLEHAIAVALAAQVGAPFIGKVFGAGNSEQATDYAQVGALAFMGDLFVTKRFMRDNSFIQNNLSLEGFTNQTALGATQQMVDASGNRYNYQPGNGWQMASGDVAGSGYVMHPDTGEVYSVLNGGGYQYEAPSLSAFYSGPSAAAQLAVPTADLPGGSTPDDMRGFKSHTPLGSHPDSANSFGYRPAA